MTQKQIQALIKDIRKNWIKKCEPLKDRDITCFECQACFCIDFLKRYLKEWEDEKIDKKRIDKR